MRSFIRDLPFKFQVLFGCLTVALIPLLLSGIFLVRIFDGSLRRQSNAELDVQVEDIRARLDQLFESCEAACRRLSGNEIVYRVMLDNSTADLQKDLYLLLYQEVKETYSYTRFSIYDVGGMLRFTTDNRTSEAARLPVHWGLLRKAARQHDIVYYRTDPFLAADTEVVLQAARPIENTFGARVGYVVLDFTKENFRRLLSNSFMERDVLILFGSLGESCYASRPEYSEAGISEVLSQTQGHGDSGRYLSRMGGNPDYGYTVLMQKSAPISSPAIKTMSTISLLIAVLGLGLCLSVSLALSRGISRPISKLDAAMKKVRDGDLSIRIHTNRKDELGRLSNSFNQMTNDLDEHLRAAVKKQRDLNDTTLMLYQTQLNPHFLYNTLDTIRWSAKINQLTEIPVLAENLALILRRSISSEPFITLRQELETISCYVEIQKIRFAGRFLYEEEIPDQLKNCLVPKMILQPLVENSILHGLEDRTDGYICIYATLRETAGDKKTLRVSVSDNGSGIRSDMKQWINGDAPEKQPGHLGLYNIIQILKLYYGKEYGVSADDNSEGGATVTISLPVQRK